MHETFLFNCLSSSHRSCCLCRSIGRFRGFGNDCHRDGDCHCAFVPLTFFRCAALFAKGIQGQQIFKFCQHGFNSLLPHCPFDFRFVHRSWISFDMHRNFAARWNGDTAELSRGKEIKKITTFPRKIKNI